MSKINRWFLVFFLGMLLPAASTRGDDGALPSIPPAGSAASGAAEVADRKIDGAVQIAQKESRDPFATLIDPEIAKTGGTAAPQKVEQQIKVELQGIGFGSRDAYAVIGGEIYYKGDEKKGIKLLEVRRREVDILVNGAKDTVPLFPEQDLQKARERAKKKGVMEKAASDQTPESPSSLSGREQASL